MDWERCPRGSCETSWSCPRLVEGYLRNLRDVMGKDLARARGILRRLIGEATLRPNTTGLMAVVRGNLAGILDLRPEVCDTIGAGRGIS